MSCLFARQRAPRCLLLLRRSSHVLGHARELHMQTEMNYRLAGRSLAADSPGRKWVGLWETRERKRERGGPVISAASATLREWNGRQLLAHCHCSSFFLFLPVYFKILSTFFLLIYLLIYTGSIIYRYTNDRPLSRLSRDRQLCKQLLNRNKFVKLQLLIADMMLSRKNWSIVPFLIL